jgi:hypothetical protein
MENHNYGRDDFCDEFLANDGYLPTLIVPPVEVVRFVQWFSLNG